MCYQCHYYQPYSSNKLNYIPWDRNSCSVGENVYDFNLICITLNNTASRSRVGYTVRHTHIYMPILCVTAVGCKDCRYFPTAFDVGRPVWDINGCILRWKDNIKDVLKKCDVRQYNGLTWLWWGFRTQYSTLGFHNIWGTSWLSQRLTVSPDRSSHRN